MTGNVPVLCLDKDRKAIFSGIVNLKGNCIGKKNKIFHSYFDMRKRKELLDILKILHDSLPHSSIKLLFQHPNPSIEKTYMTTGSTCMNSLKMGYIDEVHFVYDVRAKTNCWSQDGIIQTFVNKKFMKGLIISDEYIISHKHNDNVIHPIFGDTKRLGWAKMKRGCEHTFFIKY